MPEKVQVLLVAGALSNNRSGNSGTEPSTSDLRRIDLISREANVSELGQVVFASIGSISNRTFLNKITFIKVAFF